MIDHVLPLCRRPLLSRQFHLVRNADEVKALLCNDSLSSGYLEDEFLFRNWLIDDVRDDARLLKEFAPRCLGKCLPRFDCSTRRCPVGATCKRPSGKREPEQEHAVGVIKN